MTDLLFYDRCIKSYDTSIGCICNAKGSILYKELLSSWFVLPCNRGHAAKQILHSNSLRLFTGRSKTGLRKLDAVHNSTVG